jgi:hypothetical protein
MGSNINGSCAANPCAQGQICVDRPPTRICFWAGLTDSRTLKALNGFNVRLEPGDSTQTTITGYTTGNTDIIWSGGVWGGTRDSSGTPSSGYCAASVDYKWVYQPCKPDVAPQNTPYTNAEFSLVNSQDTYDITAINGVSVKMEMAPSAGLKIPPPPASDPKDPYARDFWCAKPGSLKSENRLLACTWKFDHRVMLDGNNIDIDRASILNFVTHQSKSSTDNDAATPCPEYGSACPVGANGEAQVCGISYDSKQGVSGLYQECGVPLPGNGELGTWTAVQLCVAAGYNNANLDVHTQAFKGAGPNRVLDCQGTRENLFACTGSNSQSCYNPYGPPDNPTTPATCCGCPNWPATYIKAGGNLKAPISPYARCYNNNTSWDSVAYPWLTFVKSACPTMYSFQYDDVTSTFVCSSQAQPSSTLNDMNYTIIFCPSAELKRR